MGGHQWAGRDRVEQMTRCFDFPEIVLHDSSRQCGRYKDNSVCLPERQPDAATTDKAERSALKGYADYKAFRRGDKKRLSGISVIRAKGITIGPDGQVVE